jgi:hypothetical protein
MRIAISLFGLIGSMDGKSGCSITGADQVLDLAYKHWYEHVISKNDQIDFFIHSWNVELQDSINTLFKPVATQYEQQKIFEVPEYVVGEEIRKQSHYSRWYSTQRSMQLKRQYEEQNNFKYDWVMSARFDIAWKVPVIFSEYNNDIFYYGGFHRGESIKVIDFWFFSNSENMDKFSDLYSHINVYTKRDKGSPRRISSHCLADMHMRQSQFNSKSIFQYGHFTDPNVTDYPLIRYQYKDRDNK